MKTLLSENVSFVYVSTVKFQCVTTHPHIMFGSVEPHLLIGTYRFERCPKLKSLVTFDIAEVELMHNYVLTSLD